MENLSGIQEVSASPKITYDAWPSAYVVPSSNSGDYETNRENTRTYAFQVRFFYGTKDIGVAEAISRLEQVVDAAIDLVDQEDLKGGTERIVGVNLPSRYMFINIWAVPTSWGEIPEQQLLMAELSVRIRLSVDVQ